MFNAWMNAFDAVLFEQITIIYNIHPIVDHFIHFIYCWLTIFHSCLYIFYALMYNKILNHNGKWMVKGTSQVFNVDGINSLRLSYQNPLITENFNEFY